MYPVICSLETSGVFMYGKRISYEDTINLKTERGKTVMSGGRNQNETVLGALVVVIDKHVRCF